MASLSRAGRQAVLNLLLFIAVVALFGMRLGGVAASLQALGEANLAQVGLAAVAIMATYPAGVLAYRALARRSVAFLPTLQVQVATGFVNRLLPAGLGSLGLFAAYFRKQGMTLAAATALVVTNNVIGVVGNLILVACIIIASPQYAQQLHAPHLSGTTYLVIGLVVAALVIGLLYVRQRWDKRIAVSIRSTLSALRTSLRPDRWSALGLLWNILLTSLNGLALSILALATGAQLDWPAAVVVLSAGTLVGAAIPTPGGIGGVEAGMIAGTLAYGLSPADGLVTVVLYRGLTYWLPIIPGVVMFRRVKKLYL